MLGQALWGLFRHEIRLFSRSILEKKFLRARKLEITNSHPSSCDQGSHHHHDHHRGRERHYHAFLILFCRDKSQAVA